MNVICRKSWHFLVIIYFVALSVAEGNYFYVELKRVRVFVKLEFGPEHFFRA